MAGKKGRSGRPTKYTKALADEVCARLAHGESLNAICRDEHIPERTVIHSWIFSDQQGFSDKYKQAREAQAVTHVDEMLDMRIDMRNGEIDAAQARVCMDITKWTAARMAPKSFGDRSEQTIKTDEPIQRIEVVAVAHGSDKGD